MSAVNSTFSEDFAQNRVTGVVSKVLFCFIYVTSINVPTLYGRHKHNKYLSVVQLIVNGVNGPLVNVLKDVEKGLGQKLEKE